MLVGLVRPGAGTVSVDGVDGRPREARTPRRKAARPVRAREIQMVFQDPYVSLDPRPTADRCLRTALIVPFGPAVTRGPGPDLLDRVGLGEREAAARPRRFSGGRRRRLAIDRALAAGSGLILDEAVTALDVSLQARHPPGCSTRSAGTPESPSSSSGTTWPWSGTSPTTCW